MLKVPILVFEEFDLVIVRSPAERFTNLTIVAVLTVFPTVALRASSVDNGLITFDIEASIFPYLYKKWCRHGDSNSGPDDYKSTALPTEL